ncbi:MAG TPA: type I restriction enzyme HsdR N-terminal domain-containing protein [Parafilimonas sp.]|nr:type I restriction enzyme HsdR N-terminal domain-containing protein [Parafilimonas sp.]
MLQINYPDYNFRIKKEKNKELIFDEVRLQWIVLTPEEWIRQNFLQYLIRVKKYPKSLLSIEKIISLGELKKRCDIVVYKNNLPWMIVECKEMNTDLKVPVLEQILRYNIGLPVKYLVLTNGNKTFAFELSENGLIEINELPVF